VLFILGIPALFLNLFFMRRRYLAIPVENRTKFHNFILRITYKKKSEYRAESSYWDALTLIQKLAIVVCQLLFTQSLPFQVVVMIMILVIFLSAHARIYPFSMRSLNHLEFMSIMSSIIVLLCGLLFYMQEFKSEREITIFGYVVLAIIAGTAGMIIVTLVWHLMAMWRQFRRRQKGD
jgi:hypothetical protein